MAFCVPPEPCGMSKAISPISITPNAPSIIGAFTCPMCAMRTIRKVLMLKEYPTCPLHLATTMPQMESKSWQTFADVKDVGKPKSVVRVIHK